MPRETLTQRLSEDLFGPFEEKELLENYPTDVYLTGILYPQKSEIAQEEIDQLPAEGSLDLENNSDAMEEISLAATMKPASAGLSFVVESEDVPVINIHFDGGIYRKEETTETCSDEASDDEVSRPTKNWRRIPLEWKQLVALDFEKHKDFTPDETDIPGLGIHVRKSSWGERFLVTVAIVNQNLLLDGYERDSHEEKCFFQTHIKVTPAKSTKLHARPLGGAAIDEDSRMAKLIYRDVKEYAVGHTCSADWNDGAEGANLVETTWIPKTTVKSMSSRGVSEFEPLSLPESGPVLSAEWLSESSGEVLADGLRRLPAAYLAWLKSQESRIGCLDSELRAQAEQHIKNARTVNQRMLNAIDLIESDPDVQAAFRLANRAIMVQGSWAAPERGILTWYPFQLGFFLLVMESLTDGNHPDREIADLLWFPTGGGKTEAYLALIAFILFLRRIRHREAGAGVASFMRYTLRLLTIQQFQRAAALVCACDAIRMGEYTPPGIDVNLTNIPFSLGLWVGGDATPNNYKKAVEALGNATAHNRPDQLKHCPRHHNVRLTWNRDDVQEQIFATCDNPDCPWHSPSNPLPVWTVDTDVYTKAPSLVIGTVDKFAQVARNERTRSLFGTGTPYRKPDLIIQDELHLISGPLGTLTGIYEAAIDRICSDGDRSRPKIVASTATIRQASSQILALFNRQTCLFPPPVLDATNSGFAVEDNNAPGRLYLGVTTAGRSGKFVLQATAASLMQSVSKGAFAEEFRDDFWTMVAYFNSLRELGGALVLMQDDVGDSLLNYSRRRREDVREIGELMELTSRVNSTELKDYLNQLGKKSGEQGCCDVVLASNMISVGVDVPRLGIMIVNGQPKGIAEYIQATSRVGRRRDGPGGLVLTIYNNAKARDRSHFESFRTWHNALYREVEATSVTPFATRARAKALHAPLIILARHLVDGLVSDVQNVGNFTKEIDEFIEYITNRARIIDSAEANRVEDELENFRDEWVHSSSAYECYWNDWSPNKSLMISAEKASELKARGGGYHARAKPTPNSMRSVEPGTVFKLVERLQS